MYVLQLTEKGELDVDSKDALCFNTASGMYVLQQVNVLFNQFQANYFKFQYRKRYVRVATNKILAEAFIKGLTFQYRKRYVRVATI